jgi:two-component system, NarL family, capsular synthesis sensor histidine kinase RcsC
MTGPANVYRKRILLAEDQPEVRQTVKLLLGMDQHTVAEAADGREALDLFAPDRFDLVITDYSMPVMRGDELAANIKQMAPSQPILMITGTAEQWNGLAPSVDALLCKPFGFQDLRRAIAKLFC